ncbi:hypothetical protein JW949_02735 [Candidatus Woesearchaeota archaeon]|nr:hypothetical protein [Candidatus Woesearchaeota archaeon]
MVDIQPPKPPAGGKEEEEKKKEKRGSSLSGEDEVKDISEISEDDEFSRRIKKLDEDFSNLTVSNKPTSGVPYDEFLKKDEKGNIEKPPVEKNKQMIQEKIPEIPVSGNIKKPPVLYEPEKQETKEQPKKEKKPEMSETKVSEHIRESSVPDKTKDEIKKDINWTEYEDGFFSGDEKKPKKKKETEPAEEEKSEPEEKKEPKQPEKEKKETKKEKSEEKKKKTKKAETKVKKQKKKTKPTPKTPKKKKQPKKKKPKKQKKSKSIKKSVKKRKKQSKKKSKKKTRIPPLDEMAEKEFDYNRFFGKIKKKQKELEDKLKKAVRKETTPSRDELLLKNGRLVRSLKELIDALKKIDENVFKYHVNRHKNDFAEWIEDVLEKEELANELRKTVFKEDIIKILEDHEEQLEEKIDERIAKAKLELERQRDELTEIHLNLRRREHALKKKQDELEKQEDKLEKEKRDLERAIRTRIDEGIKEEKKKLIEKEKEFDKKEAELSRKEQELRKQGAFKSMQLEVMKEKLKSEKDALKSKEKELDKVEEEKEKVEKDLEDKEELFGLRKIEIPRKNKKRSHKDNDFEEFLKEKLGELRPEDASFRKKVVGEDVVDYIRNHPKIYEMSEKCRDSIRNGDIGAAKEFYEKLREIYEQSSLDGIEKSIIYNVIRELYNEIQLALLNR